MRTLIHLSLLASIKALRVDSGVWHQAVIRGLRLPAFRFMEDTNHSTKYACLTQSNIFSEWVAQTLLKFWSRQEVIYRLPRTHTGAQRTIVFTKKQQSNEKSCGLGPGVAIFREHKSITLITSKGTLTGKMQ